MFRSSLAGRTPLFVSFPSTSYWATFTKSLRDDSSAHTPKPYIDGHGLLPDRLQIDLDMHPTRVRQPGVCRTTSSFYARRYTRS
jgi:hypothetical protein